MLQFASYCTFAVSAPKKYKFFSPIISFSLIQRKLFTLGAVPCGPWDALVSVQGYLHPCLVGGC